ncbi:MAG: biotin/lipoyl-containing protein [Propionibacteriaceae bacterium]
MRHYSIAINGIDHEIDVQETSAETFIVHIDGHDIEVALRDHADVTGALVSPTIQSHVAPLTHDVPLAELGGTPSPTVPSRPTTPAVPVAPTPAAGGDALTAPMPGVVLSIDAVIGQSLKRGDLLMVIEAMKMKNEIRASRDGVVASIPVAVGDQVRYGQPLVTFGS